MTRNIPLETINPGVVPPWTDPTEGIIQKSEEDATKSHNSIREVARNDPEHLIVYMDGSDIKGETGAAAYASSIWTKAATHMGPSTATNIAAAEIRGITMANLISIKQRRPPKFLTIFTDSQAAIRAVR
jgi:hypothetical protein